MLSQPRGKWSFTLITKCRSKTNMNVGEMFFGGYLDKMEDLCMCLRCCGKDGMLKRWKCDKH